MPGDDNHHNRVRLAQMKVLNLLAGLEDDLEIFPDGLPEDDGEKAAVISLLSADTLGAVLACTYLGHYKGYTEQHARHWLAELLSIFQKTVQRELPDHKFDWNHLEQIAKDLWQFSDQIPDVLPDDL